MYCYYWEHGIVNAQNTNKVKLAIGTGLGLSSGAQDLGLIIALEPKYDINENIILGLRANASFILGKNIEFNDNNLNTTFGVENRTATVYSLVPTFDYYFKKKDSKFRPFLGVGLGYYVLDDVEVFSIEKKTYLMQM